MPIRINLLAEAQALEELRRRDPVKRTIWVGAILCALVLAWSAYLATRAIVARGELSRIEGKLQGHGNEDQLLRQNKKKYDEADSKIVALQRLATNRFLNGTVLDALQHTTVDDVQLVRVKTEHRYDLVEETKAKTNASGKITPAKPAMMTEKITLTLEGKDGSNGDQTLRYRDSIAGCSYFQSVLGKTNEVRLISVVPQRGEGKDLQLFTLECRYPEKTR